MNMEADSENTEAEDSGVISNKRRSLEMNQKLPGNVGGIQGFCFATEAGFKFMMASFFLMLGLQTYTTMPSLN